MNGAAPHASALSLAGVSKRYGARVALDGVSLELPEGASLVIFGPNGAGKTTLLRVIATLERASTGSVRVSGHDLKEEAMQARATLGLVSHEPMVYMDLTALENLELYARLYGISDPRERALELLDEVELTHRAHDVVRGFSRGMKQRIAIARALVHDPCLLLLDEPYSGLDPHAAKVVDGLYERQENRRTMVSVSHDLDRGLAVSSHILVLVQGKPVFFGPSEGITAGEIARTYLVQMGRRA